jgi:phage tail-like protein
MAVLSGAERPYGSFHFRVLLGERGRTEAGFCEVAFPDFPVRKTRSRQTAEGEQRTTLLLRRGFSGGLDLYAWWRQARRPKTLPGRTVIVELLDEAGGRPVVAWTFTGCRPTRLAYSNLDAQTSAVLIETLELTFEDMTMALAGNSGQ